MVKTRAQKQINKEKKPTKTRQRKKQKTKHDDDTDQEDSNSTTDLNNQVPQSSRVESSPSRYLKQVDPSLRYKEIEKGGKCVSVEIIDEESEEDFFLDDLIARMKEGKEAEKEVSRERSLRQHIILDNFELVSARIASFNTPRETGSTDLVNLAYQVPQSSQVESPSRCLIQGEPSLRHEQIEKDGRFAAEENLGDGIGEKHVHLVEKPNSMASLGITEFVNNMAVDEDDEVGSERCAMDTIERYQVKPESMPILREILTRYGDIAKNSNASTMLLSGWLETICGIISQMKGKHLRQIKEDFLMDNIVLVEHIKHKGVDIEWLHVFLKDLLDTKQENFGKLKEEKEINKKLVDDLERRLSMAKDESTRITQNIKSAKAKVERFVDCFPVDLLF